LTVVTNDDLDLDSWEHGLYHPSCRQVHNALNMA
jgi:hypothetical protein